MGPPVGPSRVARRSWRYRHNVGSSDGPIIATIIKSHITTKAAASLGQGCPGVGIQSIDMVHPPGMVIPAAMARDQRIVARALTTKTMTLTVRKGPRRAEVRTVWVTT